MFLLLVTLISLVLAVTMGVIAWRMSQEEQRRSAARVAALAAEIQDVPTARRDIRLTERDLPLRAAGETMAGSRFGEMFAAPSEAATGMRLALVVTIGLLVFGSAAMVAVVFGHGAGHDVKSDGDRQGGRIAGRAAAPNPSAPIPVELIALGHERDGDQLTVRGIVRNPAAGNALNGLTAVVFLFTADGGFSGSGRAAIQSTALAPGNESTFVVTVPGAATVARYRVSFRTEDRVVPHVDRRDHIQEKS